MSHKIASSLIGRSAFAAGTVLLAAAAVTSAHASLLTDIQFGGFASQGYLVNTGHNDYLGNTSDGTFDFREYAANASYSRGSFRVGAQLFGQKLGPYGDDKITLDWASIDWQPAQWFGVRAGRVKMPRGLYNEALDVDAIRPFVLLPQSVYDARLRDFNASFDGAMLFGNVGVGRWGSVDYRAFYGDKQIDAASGANDYFNAGFKALTVAMKMDYVYGGTLFWNTPISGFRVGASFSSFDSLSSERDWVTSGPVVRYSKTADTVNRTLFSLEYAWHDWLFAAEAGREITYYDIVGFGRPISYGARADYIYGAASRRMNSWLELGTYFSYSQDKQSTNPLQRGADYALSAKFNITEHLIFKIEGHYINGAGKIFDTVANPQPFAARDQVWKLFAAKATYSF